MRGKRAGKSSKAKQQRSRAYARPSRAAMTKPGKHGTAARRHRITTQVMVSRRDYVFGNPSLDEPDKAIPVVQPPAILQSNSAPCTKAAQSSQEVLSREDLQAISHVVWLEREGDAAKANISLLDELRSNIGASGNPYIILLGILCVIHEIHIIMRLLLASIDGNRMTFVNDAYCAAHVMRAPGYFCRILGCVESCLRDPEGLRIVYGAAPAGARDHNQKILELCGFDAQDPDFEELLRILNDFWYILHSMTHYCQCEKPCTFEGLLEKLSILLTRVVFGRMPSIPIPARWMLVLATTRWFKMCCTLHGLGRRVILRALNPAFIKQVEDNMRSAEDNVDVAEMDLCLKMASDKDLHQQQLGKRLTRTVDYISCPSTERDADTILASAGGINYVTGHLLHTEQQRNRNRLSPEVPAPLLDMTNDAYSPVSVARQSYANMLLKPAAEN